jgi:hypothetical protein
MLDRIIVSIDMIWYQSLRIYLYFTCDILFIRFCMIELDLMRTSNLQKNVHMKDTMHWEKDTFE